MRLDLSFLVLALYSTSALALAVPVAEANNNAGLSPLLEVSFSFPPPKKESSFLRIRRYSC